MRQCKGLPEPEFPRWLPCVPQQRGVQFDDIEQREPQSFLTSRTDAKMLQRKMNLHLMQLPQGFQNLRLVFQGFPGDFQRQRLRGQGIFRQKLPDLAGRPPAQTATGS